MRSTLDPLLPTAAREAIQVIDADAQASGTLKKSVRRLLVDQREFSSTFFSAVEREIDAAVDDLFRADRDEKNSQGQAPRRRRPPRCRWSTTTRWKRT